MNEARESNYSASLPTLQIGWVDPPSDRKSCEFDWLKQHLTAMGHELEHMEWSDVTKVQVDRLVVACTERIAVSNLVERLQPMVVPSALAVGSWHSGAGRTGLRESPVPLIPWHRFWDSWINWLQIDLNQFYPAPARHLHSLAPSAWPSVRAGRGLILAGDSGNLAAHEAVASELDQDYQGILCKRGGFATDARCRSQ